MERPLDSGSIITAEVTNSFGHESKILAPNLARRQANLAIMEPSFRQATQVHDDLNEFVIPFWPGGVTQGLGNVNGKNGEEYIEIIR